MDPATLWSPLKRDAKHFEIEVDGPTTSANGRPAPVTQGQSRNSSCEKPRLGRRLEIALCAAVWISSICKDGADVSNRFGLLIFTFIDRSQTPAAIPTHRQFFLKLFHCNLQV
jgi:hypothetical protein